MHRLTLTTLLAGCAALAAPVGAATRSFIVTDFDNVRMEAPIEATVTSGSGVSARGEGDADMLERVDMSVSARTLVIRLKPSMNEARRSRNSDTARLFITVPVVRRVQLSGPGSLKVTGLDKLNAEVLASGSGALAINGIATDNLGVVQTGSGAMQLSGRAKKLDVHLTGSGSFAAGGLASDDLSLTLEGSGAAEATADRGATIVARGSGSVEVRGKGACSVNSSGSGSVNCGAKRL